MSTTPSAPQVSDILSDDTLPSGSTDDRQTTAEEPGKRQSRRSFFFLGALAAASMVPRKSEAQRVKPRRPLKTADPAGALVPNEASAAPQEWASNVVRLVRRVTYGPTGADVALATSMGYHGYLNYQLNYTRIDDDATEAYVATTWPQLAQPGDQLFSLGESVYGILQNSTMWRAVFSRRQLYQRMVEFWTDHFNIDITKVNYLKLIDDREVIRRHALGKVGDLIKASAHSAAMMAYLDQNLSRNTSPNQNYARELLELHTVGVDGGYTQDDVAELSRVLTGWTIQGRGSFTFNPAIHDFGAKTVMGMNVPATSSALGTAAIGEGERIIDMLIDHPNTARYISEKMLKWLLTPEPTETQISTVASVYKATKGDIKSMVRAILNDQWLPAAPVKFKRPYHYLVSALRVTQPAIASLTTMTAQLNIIGQPLFYWETPDGYPDKVEYWAGNILPRWSFANTLANSRAAASVNLDTAPYLTGTADAAIDRIDTNYFGGEMPLATRTALVTFIKGGTFNDSRVRDTIGLALSSAAFQWY